MRSRRRGVTPSVTGCPAVTRCDAPGTADGPGADLTAIWSSDALLDLLAERQLSRSLIRRDPALAVLSVLAADVDGPAAVTGAARRAAARHLAAWRARRLAVRQVERLAAGQVQRQAGPLPEGVAARHADLAARAAATREATCRAQLVPAAHRLPGPDRGSAACAGSVAAIVGTVLAALALAAVAAGSTGLVAAGLLARVARLGTGAPGGPARRPAAPRHGRPGHGPQSRLRPPGRTMGGWTWSPAGSRRWSPPRWTGCRRNSAG